MQLYWELDFVTVSVTNELNNLTTTVWGLPNHL